MAEQDKTKTRKPALWVEPGLTDEEIEELLPGWQARRKELDRLSGIEPSSTRAGSSMSDEDDLPPDVD